MSSIASLKFTPLEFETYYTPFFQISKFQLKFTPLEFETLKEAAGLVLRYGLKFTPLEFETIVWSGEAASDCGVKIYSVGV